MSLFRAINFEAAEDNSAVVVENVDTTAELQIEKSYQIYDEIMHLYYSKLYKQAISKFNTLFDMSIFKMDNETDNLQEDIINYMAIFDNVDDSVGESEIDPKYFETGKIFIGENVFFDFYYRNEKLDHLRYLVFRNYAMCLYDYLLDQLQSNEDKNIHWGNFIYISRVILMTSLKSLTFIDVIEPDLNFITMILNLLYSFKLDKLTRNFIEFITINTKHIFTTNVRSKMLPKTLSIIQLEINALKKIHIDKYNLSMVMNSLIEKFELASSSQQLTNKNSTLFNKINEYSTQFKAHIAKKNNDLKENIIIDYHNWNNFVSEIVDLTNQEDPEYIFGEENPDPYNSFEPYESITKVEFTLKDEITAKDFGQNLGNTISTRLETFQNKNTINIDVGFIENITNKRIEKQNINNNVDPAVSKKRTSQRVKNLSEDIKRDEETTSLQLKYLVFLDELCENGLPKFIKNSDMENFDYLKDSRFTDFEKCHSDVYDLFENWDKKMSDMFMDYNDHSDNKTGKPDKTGNQLLDVIITKLIENFQNKVSSDEIPVDSFQKFFSFIKAFPKNHYFQIKYQIIEFLVCFGYLKNETLITRYKWPPDMLSNIEFMFLSSHDYFLSNYDPNNLDDYCNAICIYEYLIELYLKNHKKMKRSKHKNVVLIKQVKELQDRIEAWNLNFFSISDFFIETRVEVPKEMYIKKIWSEIFYQKVAYEDDYVNFGDDVNQVLDFFESLGTNFSIQNYNYIELPSINFSTLQLLKTKEIMSNESGSSGSLTKFLKVMVNFQQILSLNDENSWEFILAKFIDNVKDPLVFNDILITILENITSANDVDFYTVDSIFKQVLNTFMEFLKSSGYKSNLLSRYNVLIDILNKVFICVQTYTDFLNKEIENGIKPIFEILTANKTLDHDINIWNLYTLIYSVVNYETICKNEQYGEGKSFFKKAKISAKKWKDYLSHVSVLFCFHYQMFNMANSKNLEVSVDEQYFTSNILNNQHLLLAGMNTCSYGNKVFLKYSQRNLMSLQGYIPAKNLLNQVLFCNYGLSLNNELDDHHTNEDGGANNKLENIDIEDYLVMCNYVIKKYWNSEQGLLNKLFSNSNYKSEIEKIVMLIPWKHYTTHPVVQSNQKSLDSYLSKDLSFSVFTNEAPLEIMATGTDYEKVVNTKVLLAASINFLELYFVRKAKDLDITSLITGVHSSTYNTIEQIIELLKTNIIFNMSCYEAWYLLGYCYLILLEFDLNSSADKINSDSKKMHTSTNQKKAVLCFLEALRILNRTQVLRSEQEEDMTIFYLGVGNALYESYVLPMGKAVFKVEKGNIEKDFKPYYDEYSDGFFIIKEEILKMFIRKTYETGLQFLTSCKEDQNYNFKFFITHSVCDYVEFTQYDVEQTNLQTFTFLSVVCDWAIETGKHIGYTFGHLYSNLYFNNTVLSTKNLNESKNYNDFKDLQRIFSLLLDRYQNVHLRQNFNNLLNLEKRNVLDTTEFCKYLSNACSSMIKKTKDKTMDSHQEQLVLSLIQYDLQDYKEILKNLWPVISLTSPVKPLVNINQFSIQKAGQLFVNMSLIAEMYMSCLYKLDNLTAFPSIFRKLKRSGSRMYGNVKIYDKWVLLAIEKVQTKYFNLPSEIQTPPEDLLTTIEMLKNEESVKEEEFNSTEINEYVKKFSLTERYTDVLIMHEIPNNETYANAALLLFLHTIVEPYRLNCDKSKYHEYKSEVNKRYHNASTTLNFKFLRKDLIKGMASIIKKLDTVVSSELENVVDRFIYDE